MIEKRANSLPSVNALRVLDSLARCGSLRAAAAELGVVPGAVRQQLASLEDYFRRPLIIGQSGHISLSPAGKRLADAVGGLWLSSDGQRRRYLLTARQTGLKLGIPIPMAT